MRTRNVDLTDEVACVNDADVTEQDLEFVAETRLARSQIRVASFMASGGTPPSRSAFSMSLRARGLPRGIQNREYAMRAIDACGRHHHHVAFVEQKVGETPALCGIEIPQSLIQVIANLDDARLLRRQVVADRCQARRTEVAHVRLGRTLRRLLATTTAAGISALPSADGSQHALVRLGTSFASRSRRTQNRMVSVVRRWRPSTTSSTRAWRVKMAGARLARPR